MWLLWGGLLNAFFTASEIGLISLNDNKIRMVAEAGDKKAKILHNLLSEPSRFLATIQIGITLAGFLASAFAAESFADRLSGFLYSAGVPISERLLATISLISITLTLVRFRVSQKPKTNVKERPGMGRPFFCLVVVAKDQEDKNQEQYEPKILIAKQTTHEYFLLYANLYSLVLK